MNIAIFTDVFLEVPGGIPSSIKAQKESLESLGHRVTIFCPGFTAEKDVILTPTHPLIRVNGAPLSKRPKKVIRFIEKTIPDFAEKFDLIHVHYETSCSLAGMQLARKYHLPLIQTMHGREDMAIAVNVPHPFKTLAAAALCALHRKFIPHSVKVQKDHDLAPTLARAKMWTIMVNHANFADKVITPSQHFADKLKKYGVKKTIVPVSNGVDDTAIPGNVKPRTYDAKKPLKLFWNSRVSHEKRIMPFLEALTLVKIPYELTVCGDGNALEQAKRYAKSHRLNVRFLGRIPHEKMLEKMLDQHLSITVSYGFDTQGLTLLEAEAVGLPVFFCDPDMKEAVTPGGSLIASGPSPKEMAAALNTITPEKIATMSKEMLKHCQEIYQSTQTEKLLSVCQS